MTLLFAMYITMAINSNCQIEISITIDTLTLLCTCRNSYSQIVTLIKPFGCSLATVLVVSCILFALLSIIAANTSQLPQQYISIYFNDILKLRFDEFGFYRTTPTIAIIGTRTDCRLLCDLHGCETHD